MPVTSEPQKSPPPRRPRKSGVVVPHDPRWYQRLAARLAYLAMRVWALTLRIQWDDRFFHPLDASGGPVICCVWHNRLGLTMEGYRILRRAHRTQGMAAMVSASRDGGFLAAILECFEVQPVRGSTSRRGHQALLELTTWAERGYDLAITPDGPRGPSGVVNEGVISLAQVTGLPILPFSFHSHWKLRARSWDRFVIPLPFSRCEMRLAPMLRVPREATDSEREALRLELERVLNEITMD